MGLLTKRSTLDDSGDGRVRRVASIVLVGATAAAALVISSATAASPVSAQGIDNNDWLAIVNHYRTSSKLSPVSANGAWSAGAVNHSCWMLQNGIAHDEPAGTAAYTVAGDEAGNSSNVAVTTYASATARSHIELWLSGPFHAIGILRPSLSQTGYGSCSSPPNPSSTPWKSAGTLDVVRGNNWAAPKPLKPTLFPGDGATIGLDRFVAESPDPRSFCNWGGRTVGLPIIALMPANVTAANATLSGPDGPLQTCVLTKANTNGIASSILGGDNAVVVMPANPLEQGLHTVSVASNGGSATWSFNVLPGASLTPPVEKDPETTKSLTEPTSFHSVTPFRFADSRTGAPVKRLRAGKTTKVVFAGKQGLPTDMVAVSANFTAVGPSDRGFLTASNCTGDPDSISTLNYLAFETAPNQALVPLNGGALCLYSSKDTDVVIDVNGFVAPGGDDLFMPVDPTRIIDTRDSRRLAPRKVLSIKIAGDPSSAPADASAVAVNITAVNPSKNGWVRAYPCDVKAPAVSTLNPRAGTNRPNSAIVPVSDKGTICLISNVSTDVVVDLTGWFGVNGEYEFTSLTPIRLADTRSHHPALNPLPNAQRLRSGAVLKVKVAGVRGVPATARAATLNIVAVGADGIGWIRVVPCGTASDVSNLNARGAPAIANGTSVYLSSDGSVCITTNTTTNVIVDITGVWS